MMPMSMRRVICTFVTILMVAALSTFAVHAQSKLIDPNTAAESELQPLPHMTPAIVKGITERRPFRTAIDFNRFLLEQKLSPEQLREFYRRAFVPISLNTGTREEFLLIPGVGSRMATELMEYRPWKTWAQFDKEIGKYVGQQETDRLKQYVFIPPP